MPIIKRVNKTLIEVDGHFPEETARAIFARATGPNPKITFLYEFDETNNVTRLKLSPCRIMVVPVHPDIAKRMGWSLSCERQLIMPGLLPENLTKPKNGGKGFVEIYWVPARKQAKRMHDNMQWVVMYPPVVVTDRDSGEKSTSLTFIIERKNESKVNGEAREDRGCPHSEIEKTLDRAATGIAESLRLIASDIRCSLMDAAGYVDQVSMAMMEELDAISLNEVQDHYAKMRP